MLSSYPVACPYSNCGWKGNLVPSLLKGGDSEEIASMQRAWLHCPRCNGDWEVRVVDHKATVLPIAERTRASSGVSSNIRKGETIVAKRKYDPEKLVLAAAAWDVHHALVAAVRRLVRLAGSAQDAKDVIDAIAAADALEEEKDEAKE